MRKYSKILVAALLASSVAFAGNPERAGEAGASEVLINPWARSSGWGGANTAGARGLEAMNLNIAGVAFTKKTELLFSRTQWLKGSDININAFGFSQRVGESGVMGMSINSMDFGRIQITTVDQPEGGVGSYTPQFMNINLSYSKEFSNSIFGGICMRVISEATADVKAQGVAFDAGVQYVTGDKQQAKFGIALRNVGPPMIYSGDGLSTRGIVQATGVTMTLQQRSKKFDIPSQVNMGGSYDFHLTEMHRITAAANFTSNSFTKDQFMVGAEYSFKNMFMVRGGYTYEQGITDITTRTSALTGPSAGATVEIPLGDKGTTIGLDYSYRATNPFAGVHSLGARINL